MQHAAIQAGQVCAVILAGGRATRMGGVDKGLQPFRGQALASIALNRLRQQQGGAPALIGISANRNRDAYAALGVPVWADTVSDYAGPLAGMLTAMQQAGHGYEYLLTVPCDSPLYPLDLLQRLGSALTRDAASVAMAMAPDASNRGTLHPQPVFCLLRLTLEKSLQEFLDSGERKIGLWTSRQGQVKVPFNDAGDDPHAFANVNTLDDLQQLEK